MFKPNHYKKCCQLCTNYVYNAKIGFTSKQKGVMKGILGYYLLKHSFGFNIFCFNCFNFLMSYQKNI